MIDDLDREFVALLQQRCLNGATPCEIVRLFSGRVPTDSMGGMIASEYLQEAFSGSIFETKVIHAWDYFAGGTWGAEDVGESLEQMFTDWQLRRRFTAEDQAEAD